MRASFLGGGISGGGRPPSDPSRFDVLQQVRAYWEGLRSGSALPARSQLDPRGIEGALTCAFLAEEVAPGIARFRIAGTRISDLIGVDVRGMPVSALFAPAARNALMQASGQVFSGPSRLEMDLEAERAIGRPVLAARLLMLPMLDEAGRSTLALGCLALAGDIGRAPRRLHITRRQVSPVCDTPAKAAPVPVQGFAELQLPFARPQAKPGKPYLRLIKNNG